MTTHTAAEIKATIDRVIEETEMSIGVVGKVGGYIYEGDDDRFVAATMTPYEAFLAESELFGADIAAANYAAEAVE